MIAKSYQQFQILTNPYEVNKKKYVDISYKNSIKRVRWYSDAEYLKMYPEEKENLIPSANYDIKTALGFSNDFITVFSGNVDGNSEYFERSIARFHRIFGWYIASTDDLPIDLPHDVTPHRLEWSAISNSKGLVDESFLTNIVNELRYPPSKSNFVGTIGARLDLKLEVARRDESQSYYGLTHKHLLRDSNGNEYIWNTTAKALDQGSTYLLRATIKDHTLNRRTKQTILTRCSIISAFGQL